MEDEGATRVTLPEVRSLHNLLKVTEELLFSFPLSADLVRKYEMLREGAFLKAVIHSASKIRRMQKEAHTQQRTTISPKETQTDNRPSTPPPPQVSSYNSSPEPMSFALNLSRGWNQHMTWSVNISNSSYNLTNESNRFGDLTDHGEVIKYPPIRVTGLNCGIDITPEREHTVEELELEQPH